MWNSHGRLKLVHIDVLPADIDTCYRPDVELVGNISATLNMMTETFTEAVYVPPEVELILTDLGRQRTELAERAAAAAACRSTRCASSRSCRTSSATM